MKSIVMLLSNPFRPDPRVLKEAQSLSDRGFAVTILAWDRTVELPPVEQLAPHLTIRRIQHIRSGYGLGAGQLLRIPRFWSACLRELDQLKPDFVHCHDLDTLPAGYWHRKSTGAHLVFDAHEDYPALMSLYLPKVLVNLLSVLEKSLIAHADLVITASTVLAEKYLHAGIHPVISIGNFQQMSRFQNINQDQVLAARTELGLTESDFIVAYIGGFSRNRLLLPLIQAARNSPDIHVLLWGDGHQRSQIELAVQEVPNARYLGWLDASQVPIYTSMADVIYYALRPDYPGAVFNAPNTLSNAMAAGTPVLSNNVGDLGRIVSSTGCGILVEQVTPETIAGAMARLRDPVLRKKLGEAGVRAAKDDYNWEIASERLLRAYQQLLESSK